MVDVRPAPVPSRRKPSAGRSVLVVLGAALGGLIGTLFVYYGIGAILFGGRSGWNVGQGEGFRVFCIALGAAPFAAIYWGILAARFQVQRAGPRSWWIALGVYMLAGFVLHLALDPGP